MFLKYSYFLTKSGADVLINSVLIKRKACMSRICWNVCMNTYVYGHFQHSEHLQKKRCHIRQAPVHQCLQCQHQFKEMKNLRFHEASRKKNGFCPKGVSLLIFEFEFEFEYTNSNSTVILSNCTLQGRRAVRFFATATQNWCPDKLSVPTEAK